MTDVTDQTQLPEASAAPLPAEHQHHNRICSCCHKGALEVAQGDPRHEASRPQGASPPQNQTHLPISI